MFDVTTVSYACKQDCLNDILLLMYRVFEQKEDSKLEKACSLDLECPQEIYNQRHESY